MDFMRTSPKDDIISVFYLVLFTLDDQILEIDYLEENC